MAPLKEEVYEGTWEDLLLRSNEFSGKRVKITLVTGELPVNKHPNLFKATPEERARALDEIAKLNRDLPVLPPEAYYRESLYEESLE